jgi:mevalonate pyrophosphate decarboxylase
MQSSEGEYECKRPPGRSARKRKRAIKMNLQNRMGGCGLGSSASGQGQVASCCEHGNEPSGSVTSGEFLSRV